MSWLTSQQQKQVEALTAGLQKVNAQIEGRTIWIADASGRRKASLKKERERFLPPAPLLYEERLSPLKEQPHSPFNRNASERSSI
jgi:hypothetical protein